MTEGKTEKKSWKGNFYAYKLPSLSEWKRCGVFCCHTAATMKFI